MKLANAILFLATALTISVGHANEVTSEVCRITSPAAHDTKYLKVTGDSEEKTIQILQRLRSDSYDSMTVLKTIHVNYRNSRDVVDYYTGRKAQFRVFAESYGADRYQLLLFGLGNEVQTLSATCR